MAVNLLKVTKEDNDQFSFVLNSDLSMEILNTRNDLFTVGDECHFKTANGANIIKEQNVSYSNVSLFNGAIPVATPTSIRDLFDKLTALGYFAWMIGSGGGSATRFTDLLDTFQYFGKAGQFVAVSDDELQLVTKTITVVTKSTELTDMPLTIEPGKMLVGNSLGTAYVSANVPSGSNALVQEDIYDGVNTTFTLPATAKLTGIGWNGTLLRKDDWEQIGNSYTIINTTYLNINDAFQPLGII